MEVAGWAVVDCNPRAGRHVYVRVVVGNGSVAIRDVEVRIIVFDEWPIRS